MANKNVKIEAQFKVSNTGLATIAKDLMAIEPALRKDLSGVLKSAAEIIAAEARIRYAVWSKSIPPTVRAASTVSSARVSAGGAKAPGAAALEGRPGQASFRHPVFGHTSTWVEQPTRPTLVPSAEAKLDEVADNLLASVDAVLRRAGFH